MKKRVLAAVFAVLFVTLCISPVYTLGMQTEEKPQTLTASYEKSLEKQQYSTEYEYSDEVTEGVSALISQGSDGLVENVDYVVRKNGIIVTSKPIAELTVKESVNEVVLMGTAKRTTYASGNEQKPAVKQSSTSYAGPITEGSGSFMIPLANYKMGSKYGMRNGRMHFGIDLLAPSGTDILAADSGTVVFTGYRNSYGLLVIIDHGNGFTTYYSHCSSVSVDAGEEVVKGQMIADVGRTGNATGTHVHFEIRSNGSCVNPSKYLGVSGTVAPVVQKAVAAEVITTVPAITSTPEAVDEVQAPTANANPPTSITPEAISQEALSLTSEALDNVE